MVRIDEKSLIDLEFPAVLKQLAERSVTTLGADAALSLLPIPDVTELHIVLGRVQEFMAASGDNPIPNHGFDSVARELQRLSLENAVLEIAGFRKISSVCTTTVSLKSFFSKNAEFYHHLDEMAAGVDYHPEIVRSIEAVIDRYGEVRDEASEELAHIRKRLRSLKGKINSSFNSALNRYTSLDLLDEIRESVIDNRRVLAVRSMHRKKIDGAALGSSKTGSIVYIEPRATLEYANELSNLMFEEAEEIKRILTALTESLRPFAEDIAAYQQYLVAIDLISSRARYAREIGGVVPIITEKRITQWKDAYHPLLWQANTSEGRTTWPQSIGLNPERRIVVISGPNAGGKSITLKTIGLLQLMLQSGIPVPCDPMSEVCLFDRVLTDIGDNQSIENHLSTYSYRLKMMNRFLKKCNDRTLFLIDEFGTGSDPELGGALAETFLEVFYERGAYGVITTHYTNLKLLANELPHATNANMLFDHRSLEPMFRLQMGEAGSSFTFEVAQKNGIPYSLINKAKKKIARGKVRFDKTIANLQKERSQLRKTSASLKEEEDRARSEAAEMEKTNARIREKLERYQEVFDANQRLVALGNKVDQLAERYHQNRRKKALIDELLKLVMVENSKRKKQSPKVRKAEKQKEVKVRQEVEQQVKKIRKRKKKEKQAANAVPPPKPKETLHVGDRVRMTDGRAVGTIDTIEKDKAVVNYGMFTTRISLDELEKV